MLTNNEAHRFFNLAPVKPLSFLTDARATLWPSSKLSLRKHFLHQPIAHRPVRPSQWLEPLEEAVPCEERGECRELEGEREEEMVCFS